MKGLFGGLSQGVAVRGYFDAKRAVQQKRQ